MKVENQEEIEIVKVLSDNKILIIILFKFYLKSDFAHS